LDQSSSWAGVVVIQQKSFWGISTCVNGIELPAQSVHCYPSGTFQVFGDVSFFNINFRAFFKVKEFDVEVIPHD
jgi:hypothetical protein